MTPPDRTNPRLWVEVDDLIRYFDGSVTPTGIGRVQGQILPHLLADSAVGVLRLGARADRVRRLTPADLAAQTAAGPLDALAARGGAAGLFGAGLRLAGRLVAQTATRPRQTRDGRAALAGLRPGDTILTMGGSWEHRNFPATLATLKQRYGIRLAVLVHDVLPLSHPDIVAPGGAPQFARWFNAMARLWDVVLTPSQDVAQRLRDQLDRVGAPQPEIHTIRFGSGFGAPADPTRDTPLSARRHVLYVSTIEIRKNHALLVEVWKRMIKLRGPEGVPDLLFVGKPGWRVDPLLQELRQTNGLGGKVHVMSGLSDAALTDLYRHARYTAFPSLCEGWGLPVTESLAQGRLCIASDATSIPEAGGGVIETHAPDALSEALALHLRACGDDDHIRAAEARIRRDWRPVAWADTAAQIVRLLDQGA